MFSHFQRSICQRIPALIAKMLPSSPKTLLQVNDICQTSASIKSSYLPFLELSALLDLSPIEQRPPKKPLTLSRQHGRENHVSSSLTCLMVQNHSTGIFMLPLYGIL